MGIAEFRGIVIGEKQVGESNKQLVVLAKGVGRISLSAKGAKNTKSKLLAGTQLFSYCDFTAFEGRGFYSLTQANLISSFYGLRADVERLSEAVYLAELLERTSPVGLEVDEAIKLFLTTLTMLEKSSLPPRLLSRIFELKYLQISGLLATARCEVCQSDKLFFHTQTGMLGCMKHAGGKAVSPAVQKAMEFVLNRDGKDIFGFSLSQEALDELDEILNAYIRIHMQIYCKSRDFSKGL